MSSYISANDMRSGSLYPYIAVPSSGGGSVSDARITAMGTAASRIVDSYCRDTFGTAESGTILVYGTGRAWLPVPKRIRSITSITVLDYDGTTAGTCTTDDYRIHTSFSDVSGSNVYQARNGEDGLELKQSLSFGNAGGYWPVEPYTVQIVGSFGWPETPEVVKWATAVLVWSWCRSDLPPGVESVDSGGAVFRRPRLNADSTGLLEVDTALNAAGLRRVQGSYLSIV